MLFKTARILHLTATRRQLRNRPRLKRVIEAPVSYMILIAVTYDGLANSFSSVLAYMGLPLQIFGKVSIEFISDIVI